MLIQKLYKTDTDNYMQSTIVSSFFFFLRKKLNDNYKFLLQNISFILKRSPITIKKNEQEIYLIYNVHRTIVKIFAHVQFLHTHL